MNEREIERAWQSVLRKYYPSIVVKKAPPVPVPPEDNAQFYDVYMVPDDREIEFFRFLLNESWNLRERDGLPEVALYPHSESTTREYYPHIFAEAQREKRVGLAKKKSLK